MWFSSVLKLGAALLFLGFFFLQINKIVMMLLIRTNAPTPMQRITNFEINFPLSMFSSSFKEQFLSKVNICRKVVTVRVEDWGCFSVFSEWFYSRRSDCVDWLRVGDKDNGFGNFTFCLFPGYVGSAQNICLFVTLPKETCRSLRGAVKNVLADFVR